MTIPESQLETWSHQGAVTKSAETHRSLRAALAAHTWPTGMGHYEYLQGSYPNATNIRGNSDVDLAVQTDSVQYSNLTQEEKQRRRFKTGAFGWAAFRNEVAMALKTYYGEGLVDDSGNNSIKVLPSASRLPADVVPCVLYREYKDLGAIADGMTFWTRITNTQIINYPKIHIKNGASKNDTTSGHYKPSVRMFKNARENISTPGVNGGSKYPSYFVECLLYNVPATCYSSSRQNTFVAVLKHLCDMRDNDTLSKFVTQSGRQWLFGNNPWQWNEADARSLMNDLVELWNKW